MNMFLQQLVTGISIGSVYALLAVGYALVFSVFNFSNFGFGPVMMLGAFAAFYAIPALNLPLFPSNTNRFFRILGQNWVRIASQAIFKAGMSFISVSHTEGMSIAP